MTPRPIYLTDGLEPVLTMLHDAAAPRDVAVLLCPPFGWEEMCSARARLGWAHDLAGRGYPAMRIDLPGTGDSGASPWTAGLFDMWVDAIGAAARRLRAETGCGHVCAVGVGLGGMLACLATASGAPIDELALWSVPSRGRSLARELNAFARLESSELPDPPASTPPALPEGALAAGGFALSAETLARLGAVDLAECDFGVRRALLLERDGRAPDERLRAALADGGAEVTVAPGPGFGQMFVVPPQEVEPALEVFDTVGAWLHEEADDAPPREPAPAQRDEAVTIELNVGPARLRETMIEVPQPVGRLFGVLAEPLGESAGMCVVLLNAGPQRRIGPNRMWTEMARRWAARGIPTLRIDLAGIGDSDGDASSFHDDAGFYVPEFVAQAVAALDALEERGLPPRFVLGGLCSGAYWSLYAAIDDPRVRAVLLLNPRALTWDSSSHWVASLREARDLRRKLFSAGAWRRVLRGDASLSRPFKIGGRFLRQLLRAPLRLPDRIAARRRAKVVGGDDIDLLFERLHELDKRALMVFVGLEPLHEEFTREGRMERFGRWPNVQLEVIELNVDTHTLRPVWLQREVHQMADRAVERELELLERPSDVVKLG